MHGDTATCNNGSLNTVIINAYDDETQQYNYTTGEWEVRNNDDINSAQLGLVLPMPGVVIL